MSLKAKPTVHVVFGMSAAASIRQAFAQIGCDEHVIGLADDLSFGTIDQNDPLSRQQWVEDFLSWDWDDVIEMAEIFWADALASDISPVAWFSRSNAKEYCGFLEFVRRTQRRPIQIVDITGMAFPCGDPSQHQTFTPLSLDELTPQRIIEAGLPSRARALYDGEREVFAAIWRKLMAQNSPIRIVDETGLVSAPITYFDEFLISFAHGEWEKGARIVGKTIRLLMSSPYNQRPSDLLLWPRVCALGEQGVLELSGDGADLHNTLVRLGAKASGSGRQP